VDVDAPAGGVAVWNWFSLDQAAEAALFSRKCGELENSPPAPSAADLAKGMNWTEATYREHRSLAVASVLASAAFLEASINELFASASHDELELAEGRGSLSASQRAVLTAAAEMLDGNRLLDRFQLALLLLGHKTFDTGRQPYQDAQLLVHLRNELVHYKPQFRAGAGAATSEGWLRGLESKLPSTSPFTGAGNPFFPDRCLGHGHCPKVSGVSGIDVRFSGSDNGLAACWSRVACFGAAVPEIEQSSW